MFKSLLISKMDDRHSAQIAEIAESELPQGDVEVNVDCSSINVSVKPMPSVTPAPCRLN